ncbi:MAG: hypothetical protein JNJ50_06485 [Acidobacteria bacterium]|nr:hypothetical protein [Acidobacteriota bacterium]
MSKRVMKLAGIALVAAWLTIFSVVGFAQAHPVEGSYNLTASSSELGTLTFQVTLKKEGGKWTGEIKDSPMPLTVTSVTVDDANKVTINADAGGTTVVIAGKYDNGNIAGDWTAGDMKGTWKAAKAGAAATTAAAKPAAPAASSSAAIEGTYDMKITADGQGEFPMVLVIKRDGDKLVTSVENGGELSITAIELKEGDGVTLMASFQGNPFPLPGKRTGNEMGGKWEAGGFSGTWSAKKK